jgi:uncharacterized protein YceH (UPF0502 family)
MEHPLDAIDVRVLGALIEKELTTPENYPLSLNALRLACNQSSNRDPVMQLDDATVLAATDRLRRQSLVRALQKSDSRVMKYSHLIGESMELDAHEIAVLCVLMLRGPQTAGELKIRTQRLVPSGTTPVGEETLSGLMARAAGPLVTRLPRQPGQKEARYAHLLSGGVAADATVETHAAAPVAAPAEGDRITALETAMHELRSELADMSRQLDSFRKQFE